MRKLQDLIGRYYHWLHGKWPAGRIEKLPSVREDGSTNIPGVYVVGDLTGIPLLKFSSDTGAKVVRTIASKLTPGSDPKVADIAIIGAGVSGMAAAMEARRQGFRFQIFEAQQPFSTIVNFPRHKPIYTYPTDMTPAGDLQFHTDIKEDLVDELREYQNKNSIEPVAARIEKINRSGSEFTLEGSDGQTYRARAVVVAIGRSGNFRTLGVPGEDLDKVSNRLHDPKDYCGKDVLVVGGGDSAMETAIALGACGAKVTLSYRKKEFSRPKPENIEKLQKLAADPTAEVSVTSPTSERVTTAAGSEMRGDRKAGSVDLLLGSNVKKIREGEVELVLADGLSKTIPNDAVFLMIGREAPLDFFRRSGIHVHGDRTPMFWISMVIVLAAFTFVYQWKKGGTWLPIAEWFKGNNWFPFNVGEWWNTAFADPATLSGTLAYVVGDPGFYYSILYCTLIAVFGFLRIRRRRTPYVTRQTITLALFQIVPLFLLPYILLPWAGFNGWFDAGIGKSVADALFPAVDYGSGREYWRAFGLILAWPLFIWNVFTSQPLWTWLAISVVQTFVIIPLIVYRWGKGAYCGWICSCGAMAETLGDTQRQKMPHGPFWNRLNMIGQIFLAFAFLLVVFRVLGWLFPGSFFETLFHWGLDGGSGRVMPWSYAWFVDLLWAGILGFGLYFHFSGRVWCRFACPLAALMHIYARFSKFRIFPEKSKCISCNVCTSVCHQGIDVMNFANKGIGMSDPECVRCSACVQSCPTGVLSFGRYEAGGKVVLDRVPASRVQMAERHP